MHAEVSVRSGPAGDPYKHLVPKTAQAHIHVSFKPKVYLWNKCNSAFLFLNNMYLRQGKTVAGRTYNQ
jgi:hypothetical protein